nr:alpha/beta hydrolase [Lysinibacter cavernae]
MRIIGYALLAVVLAGVLVATLSPWPSSLLIRTVFEAGARATVSEMLPSVPDSSRFDESTIDLEAASPGLTAPFFSASASKDPLPVVVWIHGGAWISGTADDVSPYLKMIAAEGYAAVGLNYTLSPETTYPTAIGQLTTSLGLIVERADELGIDANRIVLAGDSAGAQLASQLAAIITNPDYARLMSLEAPISPKQLVGTVLNCGVYDLQSMSQLNGIFAWGFKSALWAYTGTKNWSDTSAGATMSTIDFVTTDFPPTFISGGNGDNLTWLQSIPMSQRLNELEVDTTSLFWPADHQPALPHEYQFHLDLDEAHTAFDETIRFLDRVTASPTEQQ